MKQGVLAYLAAGTILFSLGTAVVVGVIVSGIVLDNANGVATGGQSEDSDFLIGVGIRTFG